VAFAESMRPSSSSLLRARPAVPLRLDGRCGQALACPLIQRPAPGALLPQARGPSCRRSGNHFNIMIQTTSLCVGPVCSGTARPTPERGLPDYQPLSCFAVATVYYQWRSPTICEA